MSANRTTAAVNFGYNGARQPHDRIQQQHRTHLNARWKHQRQLRRSQWRNRHHRQLRQSRQRHPLRQPQHDRYGHHRQTRLPGRYLRRRKRIWLNRRRQRHAPPERAANTYSGTTTITSGTTLQVGDGTNGTAMIGNASCSTNAGSVSVSGTLQYDLNADAQQFNTFTGAAAAPTSSFSTTPPLIRSSLTVPTVASTAPSPSSPILRVQLDNTSFSNSSSIVVQSGGGLFVNFTTSYGRLLKSRWRRIFRVDAHGFGRGFAPPSPIPSAAPSPPHRRCCHFRHRQQPH